MLKEELCYHRQNINHDLKTSFPTSRLPSIPLSLSSPIPSPSMKSRLASLYRSGRRRPQLTQTRRISARIPLLLSTPSFRETAFLDLARGNVDWGGEHTRGEDEGKEGCEGEVHGRLPE